MLKKYIISIVVILVLFCGLVYAAESAPIDVLSANPDSRIIIAPVFFLTYEGDQLVFMQDEPHFNSIMVSTLLEYLQEKGHAAFFTADNKGLLTQDEGKIIFGVDLMKAVKEQASVGSKLLDPANIDATYFKNAYKVFYPVFLFKKANVASRILGNPGNLDVTIYGFLLDCHTGEIVWTNSIKKFGNYNAIDLELRGTRWGHGAMWELIKDLQ